MLGRSSSASRLRRAKRAGMRGLLLAARCWERFLGRKAITKTSVGRATTAAKAATRAAQQRGDVSQAASSLDALRQKHDDLQAKFQAEIESMAAALRPEALVLEPLPIRPKEDGYHCRESCSGVVALSGGK